MRIKEKLVALALVGLTASPYAQHVPPPSPAALLLRYRAELQLTTAQVKRLQALDQGYIREARPAEERLLKARAAERRLRAGAKELTSEEKEVISAERAAIRQELEELRSIRLANREEALKVLTPTQRTRVEQVVQQRMKERRKNRHPGKQQAIPRGAESDLRLLLW